MKKIICALLMAFLLLMINIYPTFAEEINIVGGISNNLKLTIDNEQIFHKENIMPGSEWSTTINVHNTSKEALKFSLSNIEINNEEIAKWLSLRIFSENKSLYEGKYKAENIPYFTIVVSAMQTKAIEITGNVNVMADNTVQGKSLHSVWTFEAQPLNDAKSTPVPIVVNRATNTHSVGGNKHSVNFIARYIPESITTFLTKPQNDMDNGSYEEISDMAEKENDKYYEQQEPIAEQSNPPNMSENQTVNVTSPNKGKEGIKSKNKPVKTGDEHIADNTKELTDILIIVLPLIIIAFVLVWKRKELTKNE